MGKKSWTYRVSIPKSAIGQAEKTVLALDGLDTFATVKLNGNIILQSDNMFIPHRIDAGEYLEETENVLEIDFAPALLKARSVP